LEWERAVMGERSIGESDRMELGYELMPMIRVSHSRWQPGNSKVIKLKKWENEREWLTVRARARQHK